ncbi:MAG: hypothetical protein H0W39_02770 [Sphingomonas sp.]|nr:hypothetical protein [Sphingomonas sp.]
MRIAIAAMIILTATAACGQSPPATQPEDFDTVNATQTDPGVAPGALGDESVNYGEGSITPAEQNNMGDAIRSQDHPSAGDSTSANAQQ